jgi:hypothetical protein
MTRKAVKTTDQYTKAAIVLAVRSGAMSRADACKRYVFSAAELRLWEAAYEDEAVAGLRARALSGRRRARLEHPTDRPSLRSSSASGARAALCAGETVAVRGVRKT